MAGKKTVPRSWMQMASTYSHALRSCFAGLLLTIQCLALLLQAKSIRTGFEMVGPKLWCRLDITP